MKYCDDFDVTKFPFWAGGREWYKDFEKKGMLGDLQEQIEWAFEGHTPTATEINDFVWFDDNLHDLLED